VKGNLTREWYTRIVATVKNQGNRWGLIGWDAGSRRSWSIVLGNEVDARAIGQWADLMAIYFKEYLCQTGLKTVDILAKERITKWSHASHAARVPGNHIRPADQIPMALYGVTALKWSDRKLTKWCKHYTEKRQLVAWR
jgi:hypothetical protein